MMTVVVIIHQEQYLLSIDVILLNKSPPEATAAPGIHFCISASHTKTSPP